MRKYIKFNMNAFTLAALLLAGAPQSSLQFQALKRFLRGHDHGDAIGGGGGMKGAEVSVCQTL